MSCSPTGDGQAIENLRKQHLWGDISDENYRRERGALERQLKLLAKPAQTAELPNLERATLLLEDLPSLWQHKGVTHQQREALVQEVFRSITIDGKDFVSVEPNPAYIPLFAAVLTGQKLGYCALKPPLSSRTTATGRRNGARQRLIGNRNAPDTGVLGTSGS
jgi:hypothetical protein